MAHDPSDTRLRRAPLGKTSDPNQHQSGLPTAGTSHGGPVHPSPQGEVGLVGGESTSSAHPAFGRGTAICGNYQDRASVAKPQTGLVNGKVPFTLKR